MNIKKRNGRLTVALVVATVIMAVNQAWAVQERETEGEVTKIADASVTLRTDDTSETFYVSASDKLASHEVSQLLKGDRVAILWREEDGRKWVRDVKGEGVVAGQVTAIGDAWIEISLEEQRKLRLRAPWRGGNPADGGGPDREVMKKIGAARVGDTVSLSWAMPEGKRVVDVAIRRRGKPVEATAEGTDLTKAPEELYGLSGRVLGRLVDKDVEQGELTLKIVKVDRVWKNNKAKNPQSAEGRTLKIDGVTGKFLDVLLTLRNGDGVQIEVKHVRGDGLTFLGEDLQKIELDDEEPNATTEDAAGSDAPAGLSGFRGIFVGELISKDVEQGTLVFKMEKVVRVWKANRAPDPDKSIGKPLTVEGIKGKFLDTLLVLKVGDRIEVEAFHNRGPSLTFPGELLRKAE